MLTLSELNNDIKEGLKHLWEIEDWGEGRPDMGYPSKERWKNAHDSSYINLHGPDNVSIFFQSYEEWQKEHMRVQTALDFIRAICRGENPRWSVKRYNALISLLNQLNGYEVGADEEGKKQEQAEKAIQWLYEESQKYYKRKCKS